MPATISLEKQINEYLPLLNEQQKIAVLTIVKTFIENFDEESKEKEFFEMLEKRDAEYENGKANLLSLNDLEANARENFRKNKFNE